MRILGNNHNRLLLVTNGPTDPDHGLINTHAANQLIEGGGFAPYDGPAKARAGHVVPGTDPNLHPHPLYPDARSR